MFLTGNTDYSKSIGTAAKFESDMLKLTMMMLHKVIKFSDSPLYSTLQCEGGGGGVPFQQSCSIAYWNLAQKHVHKARKIFVEHMLLVARIFVLKPDTFISAKVIVQREN